MIITSINLVSIYGGKYIYYMVTTFSAAATRGTCDDDENENLTTVND